MPAQTACVSDYPPVKQFNMDFSGNQNRGGGGGSGSGLNNSNIMNMNPNLNDSNDLSTANDQQQELFLRRLAATRAANMNMNMNMGQESPAGTGPFGGFSSRLPGASGMNMNTMNAMNSMNAMNMNMSMNTANQQGPMFGQAGIAMQNQFGAGGGPSGTSGGGGGASGGGASGGGSRSGTGSGAGGGSGSNQTDREDELLLQLLLARRRRQEHGDQGDNRPGTSSNFSDELLRLRQAGNAASASSMATAAMFEEHQQNQLLQLQQQQQQQQRAANMNMAGGQAGLFSQATGLNMPPGMMMQDHHQGVGGVNNASSFLSASAGLNMNTNSSNAFVGSPGLRRSTFDDYLLQNQQPHPQEPIRSGMSSDQQRIELSPARFRNLQQHEQGPSFLDSMGLTAPNLNANNVRDLQSMKGELGKVVDSSSSSMEPPTKKKRLHKKKPSDMPRRPLSAYNLFFSEERERILKEIGGDTGGDGTSKEETTTAAADEESSSKGGGDDGSSSSSKKPQALLRSLLPSEKKRRPHRKTHGKISFRMLAQMVGQRWKALPDERRKYYQDLAKEDMKRQKQAMEDYYQKQSEKVKGSKEITDKLSSTTKEVTNNDAKEASGKKELVASDSDKC